MAIRYVLGRVGQGKSYHIFKELEAELNKGGENKLLLIVPEQFTLQTERDLIQTLQLPGIMRIEVLSFTRLAQRIFDETGGKTHTLINEQGKHMILRRIIDENTNKLSIYKKASKQEGFINQCSEFLSELKQHDISPDSLEEWGKIMPEHSMVKQKLDDMTVIYELFNQYLEGRYLDTDDYINLFIKQIDKSLYLQTASIWIDGFTTFSSQTLRIIERIIQITRDITISLTLDASGLSRDRDLFVLSQFSYRQIHSMATKMGIFEERIFINNKPGRISKYPEIIHLESELYAYPAKAYTAEPNGIQIFTASNLFAEMEYVAGKMVGLAREKGYRWRDMAVVTNDLENYGGIIKRVLQDHNVPFFIDQKRDIMSNPLIQLILYSLDIIQRGYRYEDIFRFLKTGFSDLNTDELEKLENYVLAYGIKGRKWREDFQIGEENLGAEMNLYRNLIITPLEKLEQEITGKATWLDISSALYSFLCDLRIQEKLENYIKIQTQQKQYGLASENAQIWNIVMNIFEQMKLMLGDQQSSLKEYRKVLEAGFLAYEVGIIPTTIDQVLVGNVSRSKSHAIKALFVIGVNDGILPATHNKEGLLSNEERKYINESGLVLGPDLEMKAAEERFLIYNLLTKPSELLCLSFAIADEEGRALRPSLLVDRFRKIYPSLKISSELNNQGLDEEQMISTPDSSYKYLIEKLRLHMDNHYIDEFWWDVYGWYDEQPGWSCKNQQVIQALFHKNQAVSIGKKKASQLYGMPLHTSVSRIERFVNCPFAHFVQYGLRPAERKMFVVATPDIGEIFHNSILSFTEQLTRENLNWHELKRPECELIMDKVMDNIIPQHANGVMLSSFRYKYLAQRLKRIGNRAIWTLTEHLQRGDFQTLGHELRFGTGGNLPAIRVELEDGSTIYLEGRIDRVDIWNSPEGQYIKIIDYKSGDKNLSPYEIYYGLSLQLIIYLMAVIENRNTEIGSEAVLPAGLFYFKIDDPSIQTNNQVVEVIENEIARKLKMRGLVLADINVVRAMDRDLTGYSDILPIAINNAGEFYANSPVLEMGEFQALIKHVKILLQKITQEIMEGQIRIEPINNHGRTACTYCNYRSLCQFDSVLENNQYKNIQPLTKEEVINRIH